MWIRCEGKSPYDPWKKQQKILPFALSYPFCELVGIVINLQLMRRRMVIRIGVWQKCNTSGIHIKK